MDFESAKTAFLELTKNVSPKALPNFLQWIRECDEFDVKDEGEVILDNIVEDLRQLVPFEAVLPSEKLFTPTFGKNVDCEEEITLHVDGFLFDDDYIDSMVDEGKFSRNYCVECHSRKTKPLTFITHSASKSMLNYMFKHVLPDLTSKTFVDIGSRLGPILYAAYLYTSAARIIGIEFNPDFCQVQEQVATKYAMTDRISIINNDVLNCSAVLASGDVIVMHNVFEFFTDASKLKDMWMFIREAVCRGGQLLLTSPSLDESLRPIGMEHLLAAWVEELGEGQNDEDLHLYVVKG